MIYLCEGCDQQKDNDYDLAEIVGDKLLCEKCTAAEYGVIHTSRKIGVVTKTFRHPYERKHEDLDISVGGDEWMKQARELDTRMQSVLTKIRG